MAEPKSFSKRIGVTPGKAVLIAVLGVALIGVVYVQYGPSDDGAAAVALVEAPAPSSMSQVPMQAEPAMLAAPQSPDPAATFAGAAAPTTVAAAFDESKWKPPELAMVVAYDPFAVPASFPQPVRTALGLRSIDGGANVEDAAEAAAKLAEAIESLQSELKALQERGVHVIIRGRDEYVAMIGDRTIHVGDDIDGFTVTAIEPDGVRVERKLNE